MLLFSLLLKKKFLIDDCFLLLIRTVSSLSLSEDIE